MWSELREASGRIELRTESLELAWSTDHGALAVLRRPGGASALGHGLEQPGLDIALERPDGWIARRFFARYLWHRAEPAEGAVTVTISVGIGPIKLQDSYRIDALGLRRRVNVINVSSDSLRLCGVRLILPGARVGMAEGCLFDAPGNSVRPRVPLAVAATQRRTVLPRRFFAPGLRGASALEPAPSQGAGLLALSNPDLPETLLCWYESRADSALPYLQGADGDPACVALAHEVGLAGWLRPDDALTSGEQHIVLAPMAWPEALASFHAARGRGWSADAQREAAGAWATGAHRAPASQLLSAERRPTAIGAAADVAHNHERAGDQQWPTAEPSAPAGDPSSVARRRSPVRGAPIEDSAGPPPPWAADATIYLAGAAHHGGLRQLAAELPGLAELGVDTLVLQPICRTADDGYTLIDLEQIDPRLGGADDARALAAQAHRLGMRVLLDLALQGCAAESPHLSAHPEWFVRDEAGAFVVGPPAGAPAPSYHPGVAARPGCYHFDWHHPGLQRYMLDWARRQVADLGLDGFRAVAPYSPALSWARRAPAAAGDGVLLPGELLARLRPEVALLGTLPGPAYAGLADGVYDYLAHHMFVHMALRRVTPAELGLYLGDARLAQPPGVARIGFVESHDTCDLNPLADGLRGSRISRMLLAGLVLCGYTPSLWSGQERGDEAFLRALLRLWRDEPALRHGAADYGAVTCDAPDVFVVLREHAGRRLLGLLNSGPHRRAATLGVPPLARDILGVAPIDLAPALDRAGLRARLEPFGAYCLELG